MATTVALAVASNGLAGGEFSMVVTVANTGASALTLNSLVVSAFPQGCQVAQPVYQTPNAPPGTGNPTILPASSVSYGFEVSVETGVLPGASPQAPGGAGPNNAGAYPQSNSYSVTATAVTSDGSVASATYVVPVLSATFPQSNGGALVLSQGFNLINLVTL